MIKISNGIKKGFKLKVPQNGHVRPKTSKIRKMIFDIIKDVENLQVLDLFAGCGSLGIESLSMGAKFVTFVDINPSSIKFIKDNVEKCSFENKSEMIKKSFLEAAKMLQKKNKKYDLVFIDPPYEYFDEKTLNGIIRTALKLTVSDGIIICEHPMEERVNIEVKNYRVKKYKDKYLTFCVKI